MLNKKKISIVSTCYNEKDNLQEFYDRIMKVLADFPQYSYEIIIADNCSTDGSREELRRIATQDKNFKIIFNANNVGPNRSGFNSLLNASGDAAIPMSSDLQDPPELISQFIQKWESGYKVVVGIKRQSQENPVMFTFRSFFYWLLSKFSDSDYVIPHFTGFGLYDKQFLNAIKLYNEPLPYLRGLVSKIGLSRAEIEFIQPLRKHGRSKNNFFTLYSTAMTGFVNHSKLPLRLATFFGFCLALISLLIALGYLIYKLMFWNTFNLGMAPVVIGLFFFSAIQLIFIGIIGEYIGAILTQVKNDPLVIEEEKINFD